ncbi:MAG: YkgJ family cysteine cluster protein [Putridiphycobacter sp.]
MEEKLKNLLDERGEKKKITDSTFKKIKRIKKQKLDDLFHVEHDIAFEKIDCLDCANCCKTTSPIFRDVDIKRLAKHLRVSPSQFIDTYLKIDADQDYVLKKAPCPFLWLDDNKCSVYENRPLACREYPHTNRKNMYQILNLTKKNLEICPAVCEIVNQIEAKIN